MSCYAWFYNYGVILTYLSLASSVPLGILATLNGPHITLAIVCLMVSGFLDAFDGTVARTRKTRQIRRSPSVSNRLLCDMVCFGVLPVCIGGACGLRRPWQVALLALFVLAA